MSIPTIIARARKIHRVNFKNFSLIPGEVNDPTTFMTPADPSNFYNDEGQCAIAAFRQFTKELPRRKIVRTRGSLATWTYYLKDLVPDWSNRTHRIWRVQFPLGIPLENFLNEKDWRESFDADENPIMTFERNRPGGLAYSTTFPPGDFAIWYFCPHTWDTEKNETSVPEDQEEALSQLIASKVLSEVANITAGFSDRSSFENMDLGAISARYAERARLCEEKYKELTGLDQPEVVCPTFVQIQLESPLGYRPFHPPEAF